MMVVGVCFVDCNSRAPGRVNDHLLLAKKMNFHDGRERAKESSGEAKRVFVGHEQPTSEAIFCLNYRNYT